MRQNDRYPAFAERLWAWFGRHKRTLPWRDLKVQDPNHRAYLILVSEVMLQQTQVSRVIVIFKQFTERFQTINKLAHATNAEVILAWRGMGYNSRALRLRDACRIIVEEHGGVFPQEMDQLLAIKGIGPYTAAAIRNFAFGIPTPCIDTNIRRILHRVFEGPERDDGVFPVNDRALLGRAEEVLRVAMDTGQKDKERGWHAALMDFGSAVCSKRSPKCDICPMAKDGLCKAAFKVPTVVRGTTVERKEPGRMVGSTFIPNRIFRGRIVEVLRDAPGGLTSDQVGRLIALDWDPEAHMDWLDGLLQALIRDALIERRRQTYLLSN